MSSRWRKVTSSFSSAKVYRFFLVTWYNVVLGIPSVVFILKRGCNVYILKMKEKPELMPCLKYNIFQKFLRVAGDNSQSLRVLWWTRIWEGSWERVRLSLGLSNHSLRSKRSRMSRTTLIGPRERAFPRSGRWKNKTLAIRAAREVGREQSGGGAGQTCDVSRPKNVTALDSGKGASVCLSVFLSAVCLSVLFFPETTVSVSWRSQSNNE